MHRGDAGQPDRGAGGFQHQPERDDLRRAEARDQRAGEEARPVHRHDVPLNAEIGIADAKARTSSSPAAPRSSPDSSWDRR